MTSLKSTPLRYWITALVVCAPLWCHAQQAAPSAQEIVDALKVHPVTHLRSVRNLGVSRTATADEVAAAPATAGAIDLDIQFEFNSSRITPASQKILSSLAIALGSAELAGLHFLIEGHTDSVGTAQYNQTLSLLRAEEVRRNLQLNHVSGEKLSTAGKGADDPLNRDDLAAPENRRVRIISVAQ